MAMQDEIYAGLMRLNPEKLQVINESAQHAGHSGDDGSGESHWRIVIRAPQLDAMSRLARHRLIHDTLGRPLMARIHAITVTVEQD